MSVPEHDLFSFQWINLRHLHDFHEQQQQQMPPTARLGKDKAGSSTPISGVARKDPTA